MSPACAPHVLKTLWIQSVARTDGRHRSQQQLRHLKPKMHGEFSTCTQTAPARLPHLTTQVRTASLALGATLMSWGRPQIKLLLTRAGRDKKETARKMERDDEIIDNGHKPAHEAPPASAFDLPLVFARRLV